jgi:membrane-bound lytic murein transglycosylase F
MKEDKGVGYSDLDRILDTGVLRAITLSRSTSYFDYRGEDMGFEYELVKGFADYLGVELQVSSAQNVTQMIEKLEVGEVDLIAYPVTITPERKEKLLFAYHENITNQVLVQKKGRRGEVEVKDVADLIGKEVAVVENTKYAHRLNNLDRELGGGIIIDTFSISENEETLIEKVSMGEIPFTIADNNVAKVNQTYYNNIDISVPISFSQRTAWAVRKDEKDLILKVDEWFD